MKKSSIIVLSILVISFLVGIYFYYQFPDKIVSHWDSQGQPNGYMSKFLGLFLMPLISVALFLLFMLLPKIDPFKKNIQKFRNYFDGFIIIIFVFLFYLYLLTIFWNLGYTFNMIIFLIPAFTVLLYYAGILIEHAKRNWFIGIRTPWTLSSEKVWNKTHKLGAKLFKVSAVIALLGLVFQKYAIYFVIIPLIFSVLDTTIYSYFEYKKLRR
ncbi:MAG: SdpI family protein [Candidatus Woesearchaeota archaeon]|nr:SdpI family protein [Candidatus Woesearchaeota archaeon]